MTRYLLLFLYSISLLSCKPLFNYTAVDYNGIPKVEPVLSFTEDADKVVYKAQIDLYKKHFSGIVVFKYIPADSATRIVFMSEVGITFFDFQIRNGEFTVINAIAGFDKELIISVFREDFQILLRNPVEGENKIFYKNLTIENSYTYASDFCGFTHDYSYENGKLAEIISKERVKIKKLIKIFGDDAQHPQQLIIEHKNVKLVIQLSRI
ncbi:MAG: hypothetical protein IPO21_13860 [Bacteroidales bacterium]|nr:hypothetical protein [Bacteroidales bacterium]